MKREEIEKLYERLIKLQELDEEGNVYGGSASIDADWYVLDDFLELLTSLYMDESDWVNAYYQIYMWEFQAFYEGLDGYYGNFYKNTGYEEIQRTAKYLSDNGYDAIALCYNSTIFDSKELIDEEKWPPDWPPEIHGKIRLATKWIEEHQIEIRDFFFDILFKHQEELMEMCKD